jgi:hypothetical protein
MTHVPDQPEHPRGRWLRRRRVRAVDGCESGSKGAPLDAVLRAMREEHEGGVSPDLADSVMARLGYQRASLHQARRERLGRWGRRMATGLAVLACAAGAAWLVHTTRVERARTSSMEEIVRTSLEENGRLIGNVAECVRPLGRLREPVGNDSTASPATPDAPIRRNSVLPSLQQPLGDDARPAEAPHKKA